MTDHFNAEQIPAFLDVLQGADEIGKFMYGKKFKGRRRVYRALEAGIPHFRIGRTICARRSVIAGWIAAQEQKNRTNISV